MWCEATAKGTARLVQLKPSLRGLFETVTLEPLSPSATLLLVRDVIAERIRAGLRNAKAKGHLPGPKIDPKRGPSRTTLWRRKKAA